MLQLTILYLLPFNGALKWAREEKKKIRPLLSLNTSDGERERGEEEEEKMMRRMHIEMRKGFVLHNHPHPLLSLFRVSCATVILCDFACSALAAEKLEGTKRQLNVSPYPLLTGDQLSIHLMIPTSTCVSFIMNILPLTGFLCSYYCHFFPSAL